MTDNDPVIIARQTGQQHALRAKTKPAIIDKIGGHAIFWLADRAHVVTIDNLGSSGSSGSFRPR